VRAVAHTVEDVGGGGGADGERLHAVGPIMDVGGDDRRLTCVGQSVRPLDATTLDLTLLSWVRERAGFRQRGGRCGGRTLTFDACPGSLLLLLRQYRRPIWVSQTPLRCRLSVVESFNPS